jgi:hypothetical protein
MVLMPMLRTKGSRLGTLMTCSVQVANLFEAGNKLFGTGNNQFEAGNKLLGTGY